MSRGAGYVIIVVNTDKEKDVCVCRGSKFCTLTALNREVPAAGKRGGNTRAPLTGDPHACRLTDKQLLSQIIR
jgi:hypothetical protein